MLSGKLPTGSLGDRGPSSAVGPRRTPTPTGDDETDEETPSERAERLERENERLRDALARERERRRAVVRRYERLLQLDDRTAAANGRASGATRGGGAGRAVSDAVRSVGEYLFFGRLR